MNNTKKLLTAIAATIILVILILFFIKSKNIIQNNQITINNEYESCMYSNNDTIQNVNKEYEIIKGIVELNHNEYIYISSIQHFGEAGFEIEEYTSANIDNKKQRCIDYFTKMDYNTGYIEIGDLLICTGEKSNRIDGTYNLDTKEEPIIVLKKNDYKKMKHEILKGNNKYSSTVTIGDNYEEAGYLYLKYTLKSSEYNFPFIIKGYINNNTKIIGNLKKDSNVIVSYVNTDNFSNELQIEKIEIIEN